MSEPVRNLSVSVKPRMGEDTDKVSQPWVLEYLMVASAFTH